MQGPKSVGRICSWRFRASSWLLRSLGGLGPAEHLVNLGLGFRDEPPDKQDVSMQGFREGTSSRRGERQRSSKFRNLEWKAPFLRSQKTCNGSYIAVVLVSVALTLAVVAAAIAAAAAAAAAAATGVAASVYLYWGYFKVQDPRQIYMEARMPSPNMSFLCRGFVVREL